MGHGWPSSPGKLERGLGNTDPRDRHPRALSKSTFQGVLHLCWKAQGGQRDLWGQESAPSTIPDTSYGSCPALGHPRVLQNSATIHRRLSWAEPRGPGCPAMSVTGRGGLGSSLRPQPHHLALLCSSAGLCASQRLSLAVHGGKAPAVQPSAWSISAAASSTSISTGNRTGFTPHLRTHLPGCHKPLFRRSSKAGCDFQPTTHAQDTAPLQQQSGTCVREHGDSKLAVVQGPGPRDTAVEQMQPLQQQRTAAVSTAACFCHTFLCPRHVAPSAGSRSHPESRDGDG